MEENIYYVYGYYHNNIPIYIGCGKGNRYKCHLRDCYGKESYNLYFYNKLRNLLNNNEKIEIKLLRKNINFKESRLIEQIFIELCGRKDLKKGSLYNLTNGGEGFQGYKFTEERKRKQSEKMKIQNSTDEYRKWFIENVASKKELVSVIQYTKEGYFIKIHDSIMKASKNSGISYSNINKALENTKFTAGNFKWIRYIENYPLILDLKPKTKSNRLYNKNRIRAIFLDNTEKIYNSAQEAALELKTRESCIRAVCINSENRSQHRNIKFTYL
jgi:hypothetical protein